MKKFIALFLALFILACGALAEEIVGVWAGVADPGDGEDIGLTAILPEDRLLFEFRADGVFLLHTQNLAATYTITDDTLTIAYPKNDRLVLSIGEADPQVLEAFSQYLQTQVYTVQYTYLLFDECLITTDKDVSYTRQTAYERLSGADGICGSWRVYALLNPAAYERVVASNGDLSGADPWPVPFSRVITFSEDGSYTEEEYLSLNYTAMDGRLIITSGTDEDALANPLELSYVFEDGLLKLTAGDDTVTLERAE